MSVGFTYEDAISRENFRRAIEHGISTKVHRPLQRIMLRRALRDPDKFEQAYQKIAPKIYEGVKAAGWSFDWESIMDWLMENWDEILKILLTLIPLFI